LRKTEETVLRAPISGTVQQLAMHTVGGVVTPAQQVMTIVPDHPAVMIEATVENKDVGFVHAGQEVEVKVETFTFTRYGLMHGHVTNVSRDSAAPASRSAVTNRGNSSDDDSSAGDNRSGSAGGEYVAHIRLDGGTLFVDGQNRQLEPGMSVTAEIKTGRRNVISYLLSPLARSVTDAGREQ
jgi:hemolysin D